MLKDLTVCHMWKKNKWRFKQCGLTHKKNDMLEKLTAYQKTLWHPWKSCYFETLFEYNLNCNWVSIELNLFMFV